MSEANPAENKLPPLYYGIQPEGNSPAFTQAQLPDWVTSYAAHDKVQFAPMMLIALLSTITGITFYRYNPTLEYLPASVLSGVMLTLGVVFTVLSASLWKKAVSQRKEAEAYATATKNDALLHMVPEVDAKHKRNIHLMIWFVCLLGCFHLANLLVFMVSFVFTFLEGVLS